MTKQVYQRLEACGMVFAVRPNTSDVQAVKEVITNHGYRRKTFDVLPGETWIDLGANIGAFSCYALQRGATVRAYEAEPRNAALARANITLNFPKTPCDVQQKAVVADSYTENSMRLYLSNTEYGLWRHSLYKSKARTYLDVPTVRFSTLLADVHGVKMDIEGAEIDILSSVADWGTVEKLCFEWHFDINDSVALFRETLAILEKTFEEVHTPAIPEDAEQYVWFPPARVVFCSGRK